jgi:hypothetical protein
MSLVSRHKVRVASLVLEGKTNPEIAEELGLKLHQVSHVLMFARQEFRLPPRNFGKREVHARRRQQTLKGGR